MRKRNDGIKVEGKAPGFYFYVADFLKDLRPCSPVAKGIWADFLCYMHFAKRRGYLEASDGRPYLDPELARMTGATLRELRAALAELARCGIYSRDGNGVIFNRRMVRDTEISLKRKAAGKAGGNPILLGKLDKQNEDLLNQTPNQISTPSSSPSISSSISPSGDIPLPPSIEDWFERIYARHPRKGHRGAAERAASQIAQANEPEVLARIDAVHRAYCATEDWRWKHGARAPWLDEWFIDEGYNYPPAEQESELSAASIMAAMEES